MNVKKKLERRRRILFCIIRLDKKLTNQDPYCDRPGLLNKTNKQKIPC